jgi:hypothetical protein
VAIRESEFLEQVVALARLRGWRVAHFRPARTAQGWRTPVQGDGRGFPDLLLVRERGDRRVIAAELKVGAGRPTIEQAEWLSAFAAAGVAAYTWRPDDWPEIEAVLAGDEK